MQTTHYFWNYLPLLLQILVAVGMGTVMVTSSSIIGKHRRTVAKLDTYECGIVAEGNARGRFSVRFLWLRCSSYCSMSKPFSCCPGR